MLNVYYDLQSMLVRVGHLNVDMLDLFCSPVLIRK